MTQLSDRDIVIVEDKKHHISNPYVIIIGISDYSQSDKLSDLPGVKKDVNNMYDLFKHRFGYQYVFKYLDKLKFADKELDIKKTSNLTELFDYHKEEMEQIHETDPIDGFIFAYSGHGDEECILSQTRKKIKIDKIRSSFNNEELRILNNKPRIYIFDCCRGGGVEHNLPIDKPKPKPKPQPETSKGVLKEPTPEPVVINVSKDTIYWYGSSEGMRSFERSDKRGGIFMFEVYTVICYMLENNQCFSLGSQIKNTVFNRVMNELNEKQTPEWRSQCGYQVYLSPGKQKKKITSSTSVQDDLFGDLIKKLSYTVKYEDLEDYMEGLLFGGALGNWFILQIKGVKKLAQGQISDVTEMNVAMMYGIMKMVDELSQNMSQNDVEEEFKENCDKDNRENKYSYVTSFNIEHIAEEYITWTKNTSFQLGNTIKCMKDIEINVSNMKYKSQLMDKESEHGGTKSNGSMMRIFPLILFLLPLDDDYKSIFLILKEDSELTHFNYTCHIINCVLFFICQYLIINYNDENKHINSIESGEKFLQFLTKLFLENKEKFK